MFGFIRVTKRETNSSNNKIGFFIALWKKKKYTCVLYNCFSGQRSNSEWQTSIKTVLFYIIFPVNQYTCWLILHDALVRMIFLVCHNENCLCLSVLYLQNMLAQGLCMSTSPVSRVKRWTWTRSWHGPSR